MTQSARSVRALRAALAPAFVLAAAAFLAAPIQAQTPPTKDAGGAFVVPGMPMPSVPAGQPIEWTVSFVNQSFMAVSLGFWDEPQNAECALGGAGQAGETAPQSALFFEDSGDGTCNGQVTVDGATGFTIDCNLATQRLDVRNMQIPSFGTVTIRFITEVDITAPPGAQVCNWGHFTNGVTGMEIRQTQPSGARLPSCTCVRVSAPSGFDMEATKRAIPDRLPLIPGQMDSTILYEIIAENTGTEDITNANLADNLPPGLEWVDVDTCPPGVTCTINSATNFTATGWMLPVGESATLRVRARVTCAAATDDDSGEVCNQGQFTLGMIPAPFVTDDPDAVGTQNPTCFPVIWSDLTTSEKVMTDFDDTNGNGQLDQFERVHFVIHARNAGRLTARSVVVTDEVEATGCFDDSTIQALDGGSVTAGIITWNIGDLTPDGTAGSTRDVRFSVLLGLDQICCNQAELNSQERIECGQRPIVSDDPSTMAGGDATCVTPGPQPDLVIEKALELLDDADGSGGYSGGDTVQWTITITNEGAGVATAATLDDLLSACTNLFDGDPGLSTDDPLDPNPGTNASTGAAPPANPGRLRVTSLGGPNGIQPDETITIVYDNILRNMLQGCCNQATVTYAERGEPVVSDDPATPGRPDDPTCVPTAPCLFEGELVKTVRPLDEDLDGLITPNDPAEYTITFTNVGCEPLTDVVVTDGSQPCMTLDETSVAIEPPTMGADASTPGNLRVNVASPIDPGESVTITIVGEIDAEGTCCNNAEWTSMEVPGPTLSDREPTDFSPFEPACFDAVTAPPRNRSARVTKSVQGNASCVDPGSVVTFEIVVENTGMEALPTFQLEDILPATLRPVVPTAPLLYDMAMHRIHLPDGGRLAVGATMTFTYTVQVPCSVSGSEANTAVLRYDSGAGMAESRDGASVAWGSPDLQQGSKSWTETSGNGEVEAGELVTYTIGIKNSGSCDARDVVVTDVLDVRFDDASVVVGQGGTYDAGTNTLRWDPTTTPELAIVAAGAPTLDLTFQVLVAAGTAPNQFIPNQAVVNPTGNSNAACPGLPPLRRTVSAAVLPYQPSGMSAMLLRNGFVACLADAFRTVRGGYPTAGLPPVLTPRAAPPCSTPPAINPAHPETQAIVSPGTPHVFAGDGAYTGGTCPQPAAGAGRVLVFYELQDSCTATLRVRKVGTAVEVTWM